MPLANLYRPAIDDDRRAVVPRRGHRTARHILVTPGQRYVTIIVLGLQNGDSREQHSVKALSAVLIIALM